MRSAMMVTAMLAAALGPGAAGAAAGPAAKPTYDSLWQAVQRTPNCPPSATPNLIVVQCLNDLTIWYFTRANHPAHPGVIKRTMTQPPGGGAWTASEEGWSFGTDQAAYQRLLDQIVDLDRQMGDAIARERPPAR